jgi:hypothetical protein
MQSGVSFSGLFTERDTSCASINADGNGAKTAARLASLGPNTGKRPRLVQSFKLVL